MPVDSLGFGWLVGRCGLCFWSRLPGRRCLRFCSATAASAEQCQSVLGVEGEAADRLLAGRAEGHVYPAIVGHADGLHILDELLLFRHRQVGVLIEQLLDFVRGHIFLKAEGFDLEMVCRRSEEHTSELQSRSDLVCRLLLEKKKKIKKKKTNIKKITKNI